MSERDILSIAQSQLGDNYASVQSVIVMRALAGVIEKGKDGKSRWGETATGNFLISVAQALYNNDADTSQFRVLLKYCNHYGGLFAKLADAKVNVSIETIMKVLLAWSKMPSSRGFIQLFEDVVHSDKISHRDVSYVSYHMNYELTNNITLLTMS